MLRTIRFDNFSGEWSPRTIRGAACVADKEGALHLTEIADIFDGAILIEHAPEATLLCLTPAREIIPIPDLESHESPPSA